MNQPPVSRCRSCHKPIWWRVTEAGKRQPMDYDLVTGTATQTSHFATCPQAVNWRIRKPHFLHIERPSEPA